jgi:hypothetical protein
VAVLKININSAYKIIPDVKISYEEGLRLTKFQRINHCLLKMSLHSISVMQPFITEIIKYKLGILRVGLYMVGLSSNGSCNNSRYIGDNAFGIDGLKKQDTVKPQFKIYLQASEPNTKLRKIINGDT